MGAIAGIIDAGWRLAKQIFSDNFFELYFYFSNSSVHEFYVGVFLNILAIFYFFFMLYVLNFITFIRYNFLNSLMTTKRLKYFIRIGLGVSKEDYDEVLVTLAFWAYMILTALEVLIKSSFILLIGWFAFRVPYLNLDPEPTSNWRFADFFSKSRFYSFRPSEISPSKVASSSGIGSTAELMNFETPTESGRGDNLFITLGDEYVEHLPENLNWPYWKYLRLRRRMTLFERADLPNNRFEWLTRIPFENKLPKFEFPSDEYILPHNYEGTEFSWVRRKSLEWRPFRERAFNYYRAEDVDGLSSRGRFLTRFWFPGKGSKTVFLSRFRPVENERESRALITRDLISQNIRFQIWNVAYLEPQEGYRFAAVKKNPKLADSIEKDPLLHYKDKFIAHVSNRRKEDWDQYNEFIDTYDSNGTVFPGVDGERLDTYYDESEAEMNDRLRLPGGFLNFGNESTTLDPEDVAFRRSLRRVSGKPGVFEGKRLEFGVHLALPRYEAPYYKKMYREESSIAFDSSESFASKKMHNLRSRHVYRRGLFDFEGLSVLRYMRSSTDSMGTSYHATSPKPLLHDTVMRDELFGYKVNDYEKYWVNAAQFAFVDRDIRSKFTRGRQSMSQLYGSMGLAYEGDSYARSKDRIASLSLYDPVATRGIWNNSRAFSNSSSDRLKVNSGIFVGLESAKEKKKETEEEGEIPDDEDMGEESGISEDEEEGEEEEEKPFLIDDVQSAGRFSFWFRFLRPIYQFILDHFTYWIRVALNHLSFSQRPIPFRPTPYNAYSDARSWRNVFSVLFDSFYFFRKLFRVIVFKGLLGSYGTKVRPSPAEYPTNFPEIEDFTLLAITSAFSTSLYRLGILLSLYLLWFLKTSLEFILGLLIYNPFFFSATFCLSIFLLYVSNRSLFRNFELLFANSFKSTRKGVNWVYTYIKNTLLELITVASNGFTRPVRDPGERLADYNSKEVRRLEDVMPFYSVWEIIIGYLNVRYVVFKDRGKGTIRRFFWSLWEYVRFGFVYYVRHPIRAVRAGSLFASVLRFFVRVRFFVQRAILRLVVNPLKKGYKTFLSFAKDTRIVKAIQWLLVSWPIFIIIKFALLWIVVSIRVLFRKGLTLWYNLFSSAIRVSTRPPNYRVVGTRVGKSYKFVRYIRALGRRARSFMAKVVVRKIRFKFEELKWDIRSWFDS